MGLFHKRKPREQLGQANALPGRPYSKSASELVGNTPQPNPVKPAPAPTKSAEQLELELARKNTEIRELQDKNLAWQQVVARTTQPNFPTNLSSPTPSLSTLSPAPNGENSQSQEQLEVTHNYAPEVVVESHQVKALTPWNSLEPQRHSSDATEPTAPAPLESVVTDLKNVLLPNIAKIAQAAGSLFESRPDVGLAILLSVTILCLSTLYILYSIVYAHMGYILIGFLAIIATYSIGRYLFIIKQTEVQVKREEVQVKREEVQQEWIRSIGSKLQNVHADSWAQPVQGRRALMPVEGMRIEEIID